MNIGGEEVDRSQPNNNITSKSNPHFLWGISYKDILLANVDGNVKWNIPVESLPTDKQKWYYKVHNWKSIWLDFPNFSCDLILTKREESEIYSLPQHMRFISRFINISIDTHALSNRMLTAVKKIINKEIFSWCTKLS